jgi:hypothetical protein
MATTFGSNLGSNSNGGFAIYPMTTTGAETVTIFKANLVTGEVTLTVPPLTNPVPFTSLQLAALSALLKRLISVGVPDAANAVAYLRKLVGVVSLTSGTDVALAAVGLGGGDYGFNVNLDAAGTALIYVPNSAAAGLFTGFGADSIVIPPTVTTQRYDAIANVPGLYLPGAVCIAAPLAQASVQSWTVVANKSQGNCLAQSTGVVQFLVEKYLITAGTAPGAGSKLFDVEFQPGFFVGSVQNIVAGNLVVAPGEVVRVVNPVGGDATLADVSIVVGGTMPLV